MREIKFRGKRIADGEWIIGDLITEINVHREVVKAFIHLRLSPVDFVGDSLTSKLCLHEVDPETVGQYTGLDDGSTKEIYEGDIYQSTIGDHLWVYEVKAIGGQFGGTLFGMLLYSNVTTDENDEYYTFEKTIENRGTRSYVGSGENVEVIGNVHDNPELLGVE